MLQLNGQSWPAARGVVPDDARQHFRALRVDKPHRINIEAGKEADLIALKIRTQRRTGARIKAAAGDIEVKL